MVKKILVGLLLSIGTIASITEQDAQAIGRKIWLNEGGGKEEFLVFWNKNEAFPSLGIGHYIWYPAGKSAEYTEGFPELCAYLQKHNVTLPHWLTKSLKPGAPWVDRDKFLLDTKRTNELRKLLAGTVDIQAKYMVDRFKPKLTEIINHTNAKECTKLRATCELMLSTPTGAYALIDYLNFKGDGLNPKESRKGDGWGLLQVLQSMPANLNRSTVNNAFADSAAAVLKQRCANGDPQSPDYRFLEGWLNRVNSYRK